MLMPGGSERNELLVVEMMMLDRQFRVLTIVVLALTGVLISSLVLIPPIRKWGRYNKRARRFEILLFAWLSFTCGAMVVTWLNAALMYEVFGRMLSWSPEDLKRSSPGAGVSMREDLRVHAIAIVAELWARQLVPPPWQRPCYAGQVAMCDLADEVSGVVDEGGGWTGYGKRIGPGVFSVPTGAILAWLYTRRRRIRASR